jgi:predicted nucleic acid-binding protein
MRCFRAAAPNKPMGLARLLLVVTAAECDDLAPAADDTIPIRLVEVDIGRAMARVTERGLYAYDAYMLELASSRGLPLLTLDAKLSAAARHASIGLVEV